MNAKNAGSKLFLVRWFMAGGIMCFAAGRLWAQIPEISAIGLDDSAQDGSRVVTMEVGITQDGVVSLESSANLHTGAWSGGQGGAQASAPVTVLALPQSEGGRAMVYRAWFVANQVSAGSNMMGNYEVDVPAGSTVADVLQAVGRDLDLPPYLVDPDQMTDTVAPGVYSGQNIEELMESLNVRAWHPPPEEDDVSYAMAHYKANQSDKPGVATNFPADVGTNTIEVGWGGDPAKPAPVSIAPPLPAPGSYDKPFDLDIAPDDTSEPIDAASIPEGFHLRLTVLADPDSATLRGVRQLEGSAMLPGFPPAPPDDAFVWLARSPQLQGTNHNIYYINVRANPWKTEVLDDTGEYPNNICCMGANTLRIPVPIPDGGSVSNLVVEMYRYVQPAAMDQLSITNFIAHSNRFALLLSAQGSDLTNAMAQNLLAREARAPRNGLAAPKMEVLHAGGDKGKKFNMVVIGDGFTDTFADQKLFTDYVYSNVLRGFLMQDINREILNALNIYQIQTYSTDSGVTLVNTTGSVVVARNTALDWRYSGLWGRCWMEPGPQTGTRSEAILDDLCPQADYVITILNTNSRGGCARGNSFAGTIRTGWFTLAHEFGHMFGKLGDEYRCVQGDSNCTAYTGAELGSANLTTNAGRRATLKWKEWVPEHRPIPTTAAQVADIHQDVGLFEAATIGNQKYWRGIFRPTQESRMSENTPLFNPIGYTMMRENARLKQEASFLRCTSGDFNGDGKADVVIQDGRQIGLFVATNRTLAPKDPLTKKYLRPSSATLSPAWYHTGRLTPTNASSRWDFRSSDKLFAGDFNGDGLCDLYVVNLTTYSVPYLGMLRSDGTSFTPVCRYRLKLPGWDDMRENDQFFVLDFDGDNLDDLLVYNGQDWDVPYLAVLRSSGSNLLYQSVYTRYAPGVDSIGVEMGRNERIQVGRFQDNGYDSVVLHNRDDFAFGRFLVFGSSFEGLTPMYSAYGSTYQPFWTLSRHDELHVVDFTGEGLDDLVLFNGKDYTQTFLCLFRNDNAGSFLPVRSYNSSEWSTDVSGWQLARRDRFWPADVNGDGYEDLVVFNGENWDSEYIGILRSDGANFYGSWQRDFVGGWNLGNHDQFVPAEFRGGNGWTDLFVYNKDWFGMLRGYGYQYKLETIYPKWIHNHRYHAAGWW